MPANPLDRALRRAVRALAAIPAAELRQLSLPECALVLGALPDIPELVEMRRRLAERLRNQLRASWIEAGDLYEVFSMLTALWRHDPAQVTGEHLAWAVQRLMASEVVTGGPYYSNHTIAVAANVQVAVFIRLVAKPLPNLEAFLMSTATAEQLEDAQLTRLGLLYLLAQAGGGQALAQYGARNRQQTAAHEAIALSIFKGTATAPELKRTLAVVCGQQQRGGFWDGEPLLKAESAGVGARLTTTALIVEALAAYRHRSSEAPVVDWHSRHQGVTQAAKQSFRSYAEPLRSSALATIDEVCGLDQNFEITLLPELFARALAAPARLTNRQYTTLGLASLCGWIAYTIYDDFLDHEGTPAKLPVANIAMRVSLNCFRAALPGQNGFQRYVAHIFAQMDAANAWEVSHCRFTVQADRVCIPHLPRYGGGAMLAARSFAHALAPIAVLAPQSPGRTKETRYIKSAFRHYLIARQLNDDLHDWIRDMQAGQASYVVVAILRDMRVKPDTYDLPTLLPAMQRRFRRTTMPHIGWRILRHIERSRRAFAQSRLLRTDNDLYLLLDRLEGSVRQSLDEQSKSQAFGESARRFDWGR